MDESAAIRSAVSPDVTNPRGYARDRALQERFDQAAARLLERDGWVDPHNGSTRELVADLALEGGGVKGIGLAGAVLVLDEAGYRFRGVAGTSAGAIAATLIAALSQAGRPMTDLKRHLDALEFTSFMPEGKLHHFLDHLGGQAGQILANAAILSQQMGIYTGDYLRVWLEPILEDLGVRTFKDLALPPDPGGSVPKGRSYRLLVHVSDITRGQLVRLPWDYCEYGMDPDDADVVGAVRASMSIPFFFEPVLVDAQPAKVEIPTPDGRTITRTREAGTVTWVDGGLLRNFPIAAFDRADGEAPRWPTIGIKLSSLQTEFPSTTGCGTALGVGIHCLRTMMNEWDSYAVDEGTAGRTIFVDNAGLKATDFDLTPEQQNQLFLNGVAAATEFVIGMAAAGGVPRSASQARALIRSRRQL